MHIRCFSSLRRQGSHSVAAPMCVLAAACMHARLCHCSDRQQRRRRRGDHAVAFAAALAPALRCGASVLEWGKQRAVSADRSAAFVHGRLRCGITVGASAAAAAAARGPRPLRWAVVAVNPVAVSPRRISCVILHHESHQSKDLQPVTSIVYCGHSSGQLPSDQRHVEIANQITP